MPPQLLSCHRQVRYVNIIDEYLSDQTVMHHIYNMYASDNMTVILPFKQILLQ